MDLLMEVSLPQVNMILTMAVKEILCVREAVVIYLGLTIVRMTAVVCTLGKMLYGSQKNNNRKLNVSIFYHLLGS